MIARMWHGIVRAEKPKGYREFLLAGDEDMVHSITLTLLQGVEAIRSSAGQDETLARNYPDDQEFLRSFELLATHYAVEGGA